MADIQNGCTPDPILLAEIVLDTCENEFGAGPCTATGEPCYNYYNGCKDKCNFKKSCAGQSTWLSTCAIPKQLGIFNYLPWIQKNKIQWNPSTALLGETFSTRGGGSFCVKDLPHTDQGFDPYWPRDGVIPICPDDKSGTLISRWVKRVKYFEGRRINLYSGHCDMMDLCEFKKQTFLLDNPRGPDSNCEYCFEYRDILSVTEEALIPTDRQTTLAVFSGDGVPFDQTLGINLDGVATDEEPDADPLSELENPLLVENYFVGDPEQDEVMNNLRHICVDGEVIPIRSEINNAVPAGWNFRLKGRAACGSTLSPHEAGAEITLAKTYPCGMHVANVICDMLENAGINEVFTLCCEEDEVSVIDYESFKQWECENLGAQLTEDIVFCEQVPMKDELDNLSNTFGFLMYQQDNRVKIKSFRPGCLDEIVTINTCNIVSNTFTIDDDFQPRYSQVVIRHSVKDWSKGIEKDNLSVRTRVSNGDITKRKCESNGWSFNKTYEINTRWLGRRSEFMAQTTAERLLLLLNCPPQRPRFEVLQQMAECLSIGDTVELKYSKAQNEAGEYSDNRYMVQSIGPIGLGVCHEVVLQELPFDEKTLDCLTCDTACPSLLPPPSDNCSSDCQILY